MELDWEAYWERFKAVHGKDPVQVGGRFLFPDGWTYACDNFEGPEWPPPAEGGKLLILLRLYWKVRRRLVLKASLELREWITGRESLQASRSLPLSQLSRTWDKGAVSQDQPHGSMKTIRGKLDLTGYKARLAWLEEDVRECERMLKLSGASETAAPEVDHAPTA